MRRLEFFPVIAHLPQAACRDIENPDVFFPDSRQQERESLPAIRELCDGCTVRKECLEYALNERIMEGIWAGFTPAQRKSMIQSKKRRESYGSIASAVRHMTSLGYQPKEIANRLNVEPSYVNTVLRKQKAKLEGEIQSQPKIEGPSGESLSSSGFRQ